MKLTTNLTRENQCANELFAWLNKCWRAAKDGSPMRANPFYERNDKLTPDVVEAVIGTIERNILFELKQYPAYHRSNQGIRDDQVLVTTAWDKLEFGEQLAIVQGIDEIYQRYKAEDDPPPTPATEQPVYYACWC